jgi:enoyl-CoA hydratase/carnithine racemase
MVKVVILTGAGRGFCRRRLQSRRRARPSKAAWACGLQRNGRYFFNDLRHKVLQSAMKKLEDLPQVTIAAINGPAVGVGLEMATLCDMRIASDKARVGEVAVPAGFVAESGGARNLPKLIGIGRAMRMILTGEIIDAKAALRIGLVEEVVKHDELMNAAFALAGKIAANPYLSVRQAKRLVKMYWNWNRSDEGYQQELEAVLEITRTKDCQEGMRAFVEKRPPRYTDPYGSAWPFPAKPAAKKSKK